MIRIGEMLVALSACPPEAVQEALRNQAIFGARLGTNLLELGAIEEMQLASALARLYRAPVLTGDLIVDPRALALVPKALIGAHDVMPYTVNGPCLRVIMADPRNVRAVDDIAFATGKKVEVLVAPEARLWSLLHKHYGLHRGKRMIDGVQPRPRWAPRLVPARSGFALPVAADIWTPDQPSTSTRASFRAAFEYPTREPPEISLGEAAEDPWKDAR